MYLTEKPLTSSEECPTRVLHLQRRDFPCDIRDVMTLAKGPECSTPDYELGGRFTKKRLIWFTCEGALKVLRSNSESAFEQTLEAWNEDPDSFDRMKQENEYD